jgi:hypothetical protein
MSVQRLASFFLSKMHTAPRPVRDPDGVQAAVPGWLLPMSVEEVPDLQ